MGIPCGGGQGEIHKEKMIRMQSKKKLDIITTAVFGFIFLVGLSVMLYPTLSNWWNRNMASHTVSDYKETVAQIDTAEYEKMLEDARAYNEQLAKLYAPFTNFDTIPGYDELFPLN